MSDVMELSVHGPFDLLHQNGYFHGWPELGTQPGSIVLTFPVEGWLGSAAVVLRQHADGRVEATVSGTAEPAAACRQAAEALSLDVDGRGWPALSSADPRLGRLQEQYRWVRPTLFHSPYEAAAHFVIGHRTSAAQARRTRAAMAEALGEHVEVAGEVHHAFPSPMVLRSLESFRGLSAVKIDRLHAIADAATDGWLVRAHLRAVSEAEALSTVMALPGVGPFFAGGIVHRGAGTVDGLPDDQLTTDAIRELHDLPPETTPEILAGITDRWRPYRTWASVLLHLHARRSTSTPAS